MACERHRTTFGLAAIGDTDLVEQFDDGRPPHV